MLKLKTGFRRTETVEDERKSPARSLTIGIMPELNSAVA